MSVAAVAASTLKKRFPMRLGFALLTHDHPEQLIRLVRSIRLAFPESAIACHHDTSQSDFDTATLREATFVTAPYATAWGQSSVVEGALSAIRLLRDSAPAPDWYYLLSGSDFLIKPPRRILRDLAAADCDVFIDHTPILKGPPSNRFFEVRQFRYFSDTPPAFPEGHVCYAGEHWFTANRRAIDWLLDHEQHAPGLWAHYKALEETRPVSPDESFYHTVFCNAPPLTVRNDSLRYIDWSAAEAHPKTLTLRDLPRIMRAGAHFARKAELTQSRWLLAVMELLLRAGR